MSGHACACAEEDFLRDDGALLALCRRRMLEGQLKAHALTTDGRPVAAIEAGLRKYLPGLDVRLRQFSPLQAIVPGPLLRALELEYGDAAKVLSGLGVLRLRPMGDDEVVAVLKARDLRDLAPRPKAAAAAVAPVAGLDWHLNMCRVGEAWTLVNGPDNIDWIGVSVGQIDTGYTRHPAYGFPSTWVQTAAAETFWPDPPLDAPTLPPPELGKGQSNLIGVNKGHGTKTGCTVSGSVPASDFYGVAPKVPFVPVRICDVVWINDRQREFAKAVRHLVDTAGVRVINVSLGIFPPRLIKELKRAVDHAYDNGVIMVCAAGNVVQPVVAPACMRRTLAIAGVTSADVPWSGSSFGPEVDLSAPAADIRNALASPGDKFSLAKDGDGTSYAAAMVSGAAALWLSLHRADIAATYTQQWQVVEAFKHVARATARKPANWQTGAFGEGVLDVRALLAAPLPSAGALVQEAPNA